ncbi:MAG: hypothetical protein ACI8Y4_000495 [Candidatus Poriferisodalaceae bacterium]
MRVRITTETHEAICFRALTVDIDLIVELVRADDSDRPIGDTVMDQRLAANSPNQAAPGQARPIIRVTAISMTRRSLPRSFGWR